MDSRELYSSDMQSAAERGLSSFLQAIAESSPDTDLQSATSRWIRALETTPWNPEENTERFIRRVTINALTTNAQHIA